MGISFNKVIIAGNLVRDPELKYTNGGKAVVNFTLAVNNYFSKEASFFNVTAWDKIAENCNKYLKKGSSTLVDGYLVSNSYTDKNGDKKTTVKINAQSVQFLDSHNTANHGDKQNAHTEPVADEDVPF